MGLIVERVTSSDVRFVNLVVQLDEELAQRDGASDHAFYHQFNQIDDIKYGIVISEDGKAVGCGAIKPFDKRSAEVKRMYVPPSHRNKGLATELLNALEVWAKELGFQQCVLETGKRQPEV